MIVKQAKKLVHQWVLEKGRKIPGFYGAFFHGSINYLAEEDVVSNNSDVDVMIVLTESELPPKLGKFIYKDLLIEVSYLSKNQLRSADYILGQYHLAGSFRRPSVILDPSGQLTKLQANVSKNFTKKYWVSKRCKHARNKIINGHSLSKTDPFFDQVNSWLFPAGITTHMLLVAGLKNPTVRRRYVLVKELLESYNHLDFYQVLLELLGCVNFTKNEVKNHLRLLTSAFDKSKDIIKTPFFFASDISDISRPIAIDGSLKLIEHGYHREAIFWIVATYSRCQKIFYYDGSEDIYEKFDHGYRQLLADLGIISFADLQQRLDQVKEILPKVWDVAESIIKANPEIED